ncbi:MAG TPA: hypothetical protein VLT33_11670 [Labilithrix sp.]|nr:hypothetical protein [Labilithrix sp.]
MSLAHHPREDDAALRRVRRDLRGLVGLEWLQTSLALGGLLAVAARAIVLAEDPRVASAIFAVVLLGLVLLVLAVRLRAGQELLRRELQGLEELEEGRAERPPERGHPYRHAASTCRCMRERPAPR